MGTREVAIAPIVSSARAAKLILRRWAKEFARTADFVVIEGCKAGGHLGFAEADLLADHCQSLDEILPEVLAEVQPYEAQFGHAIPVFVAGGIYDRGRHRPTIQSWGPPGCSWPPGSSPTYECDASQTYKDVLLGRQSPEDVRIIHTARWASPGRALNTPLVQALAKGKRLCAPALRPLFKDLRPRKGALLHHPRPHRSGEGQCGRGAVLLRSQRGPTGPDVHRPGTDGRIDRRMEA